MSVGHHHDHGQKGHSHGGHGHDHHHGPGGHNHAAGANARALKIALGLTGGFMLAEVAGAFLFNSLALLSDAAHMFTDTAALAIALLAIKIGERAADEKRTYGYRRLEILAAAFNAVLLFVVSGYILFTGLHRLINPVPVESAGMIAVAALGLLVNLIAMRVLVGGKDASLNMKGAYLEVWADAIGSIGVIAAAGLIWISGWNWIDPVVAFGIGIWVLPRTWVLLRDTTHILLQGVPPGYELKTVRAAMNDVAGVAGVHDLHLWSVAGDDASLTAHVELATGADGETVRKAVAHMLDERFHIHHVTIQTEAERCTHADSGHD